MSTSSIVDVYCSAVIDHLHFGWKERKKTKKKNRTIIIDLTQFSVILSMIVPCDLWYEYIVCLCICCMHFLVYICVLQVNLLLWFSVVSLSYINDDDDPQSILTAAALSICCDLCFSRLFSIQFCVPFSASTEIFITIIHYSIISRCLGPFFFCFWSIAGLCYAAVDDAAAAAMSWIELPDLPASSHCLWALGGTRVQ